MDENKISKKEIISKAVAIVDRQLTYFLENKQKMEEYYNFHLDSNKHNQYTDNNGNSFVLEHKDFSWFYEQNIAFIQKQKKFLNRLLEVEYVDNQQSSLHSYMSKMLEMCIQEIKNAYFYYSENSFDIELLYNLLFTQDISKIYQSILLLKCFSTIKKDIILIGGNGSGKTSFANSLKGNDTSLLTVVPAQKNLYYSISDLNLLTTNKQTIMSILLENNIGKTKSTDDYGTYYDYQNNQFTRLIEGMKSDYLSYLIKQDTGETISKDKVIFNKLKEIFDKLFPDIKLFISEEHKRSLMCEKNGNIYNVNALSEGEKAIIYYSISVLLAKENGCVIVDEPETYINPSLTNHFWDLLTNIRNDCQFIFITHSIDFVLGRTNAKIAWIKNFEYPDNWDFELLDDENELPKPLLTEILGTKKPIIYCEGNDKSSLDFRVYNGLLENWFTVIPVGGHRNVVSCVNASKTIQLGYDVYGIIDGDEITEEQKIKYKQDRIIVLPFNEIEMFLLEEKNIRAVMETTYSEDFEDRITIFLEKFWNEIFVQKRKIVLSYVKSIVDSYLESHKIESTNSIEDIEESLKRISDINIKQIYEDKQKEIDRIIDSKNYRLLLKVCNLKKRISKGLANNYLDSDYEKKIVQKIHTDIELQNYLRKKYFSLLDV